MQKHNVNKTKNTTKYHKLLKYLFKMIINQEFTKYIICINLFIFGVSYEFQKLLNQEITDAKVYYQTKFNKDESIHFLGYDETEYPAVNEKLRKIQFLKWEEYYKCLLEQDKRLKIQMTFIPEADLVIEGGSVK